MDETNTILKQYNIKKHYSAEITPLQASLKKNEGYAYQFALNKRKKINAKFKSGYLVRTADKGNIFTRGVTANWCYRLYTITKSFDDTVPTCRIKNLLESYNEAWLKKLELTGQENEQFKKN